MQLSQFERAVIAVMIKGDPEEPALREQLQNATVIERNYSGIGIFVELHVPESALRTKTPGRYIEAMPMAFLKHPDLEPGAQAMLWFKDSKMSTLECFTLAGEWPSDESQFLVESYAIPGTERSGLLARAMLFVGKLIGKG